jgi:hypothetical protein
VDGRFVTNGQPLRDVLPELHRWYLLDFRILDKRILENPVTMDVALGSSKDAMEGLQKGGSVRSGWLGKEMVLGAR